MSNSAITDWFDGVIRRSLGSIPCRYVLLIAFATLLIGTVALTSSLLIANHDHVLRTVLEQVADRAHGEVRREIVATLRMPDEVNRHIVRSLQADRVSPDDDEAVLRLLHDVPRRGVSDAVAAMYVGFADGRYFGFGADASAWPPANWRYAYAGPVSDGYFEFRTVLPDGRPGDTTGRIGRYDPRTRPWYRQARETVLAAWTDVYPNFEDERLVLTRIRTWRDSSGELLGVSGVDLFLRELQQFLDTRTLGESGAAFIVRHDGKLIAATGQLDRQRPLEPLAEADAAPYRFVREAARLLESERGTLVNPYTDLREHRVLNGEPGYLLLSPIARDAGLDWTIGIFLPERDYIATAVGRFGSVLPLALLVVGISLAVFLAFVSLVVRPLRELRNGASLIADGDFEVEIETSCQNEVGDLARAIDDMQDRLRESFAMLDDQRISLEATLEAIEDGVVMLDGEGKVRYLNRVAENVTGVDRASGERADVCALFRARADGSARMLMHDDFLRQACGSEADERRATVIDAFGMPHGVRLRAFPITDVDMGRPGLVLSFTVESKPRHREQRAAARPPDPLDSLVDRSAFEIEIARLVARSQLDGTEHVLGIVEFRGAAGADSARPGRHLPAAAANDDAKDRFAARDRWSREIAAELLDLERRHVVVARFDRRTFAFVLPERPYDDVRRRVDALRDRLERRVDATGAKPAFGLVEIDERTGRASDALEQVRDRCRRARVPGCRDARAASSELS